MIRYQLVFSMAVVSLLGSMPAAARADTPLQDEPLIELSAVQWMHGHQDCEAALLAKNYVEWQLIRYRKDTYVLRQNKCSNYEVPFVYLFIGAKQALLVDSGATAAGGVSLVTAVRAVTGLPVVAAHSHGHGDHLAGDAALKAAQGFTVIGSGPEALQDFFQFEDWPRRSVTLDLGGRDIELLPIPGHHDDDIAFYDSRSKLLITGDTVYPGRLYVGDWAAYQASIARLMRWVESRDVALVLGTHIEMSRTPNVDYPVGTTYQPEEVSLPLGVSDIARLEEKISDMETPARTYFGNFILWPKRE